MRASTNNEPEINAKIIELALFIADLERGSVVLLQAWRPFGEHCVLNNGSDDDFSAYVHAAEHQSAESLKHLRDSFGNYLAGVEIDLYRGHAEEVIPEYVVAHGIDLVVLGAVTRTGIAGLLVGDPAKRLLQMLPCSVLAVKPDGFVSPVRLESPRRAHDSLTARGPEATSPR